MKINSRVSFVFLAAALLLAIGAAVQAYAVRTGRIPPNSDQAIVGLMAKHILEGRGHPVFYYGSTYAGSLEPHYVAGVFALFGASFASYRAAMALLLLATMTGVFLLTLRLFGRRAALFALAYLAVPPFFFLYKGLTSDGAYGSLAFLSLATVASALWVNSRREVGGAILGPCALLGLAIGLNWWVTPVSAPVSAVALGWLWATRRSRLGLPGVFALMGGFLLGSFPWWVWNLRHGWASLKAAELTAVGPASALGNLAGLFTTTLPTLAGGVQSTPNLDQSREIFPFSRALALALLLLLIVAVLRALSRGDRSQGLLLFTFAALVVAAAFSRRLLLSEPRYLFPYYVLLPPLAGAALSEAWEKKRTLVLGAAAGLAALFLNVCSLAAAPVNRVLKGEEVTGSLASLIAGLEHTGIQHLYTTYWVAYRLSFESGERIIATPLPGEEMVRYPPYAEQVGKSPNPAVVLLPPRSTCFRGFLEEKGFSFRSQRAGGFDLFSDLPPPALEPIRAGKGLPFPSQGYRASWILGPQPERIDTGEIREARLTLTNRGPCVWSSLVRASYHWWPLGPGGTAVWDGARAFFPAPLYPQASMAVTIKLIAPPSPGRYRLEYDLVHEGVDWFSTKGGETASVEVTVE